MADLSAKLNLFKPTELIVFLAKSKKDGCLHFQAEDGKGKVFLKGGKVVHAELDEWIGMDALLTISLFDSGSVEFSTGVEPSEETITEEWSELSEKFDRRRIELEKLKEKLPTMDTILYKSPNPVDESLSLRRSDWQILALIDSRRNLGGVVKESKLGLFDALNSLNWLIEKGLVTTTPIETKEEEEEEEEADWTDRIEGLLNIFFEEFSGKGAVLKGWPDKVGEFDEGLSNLLTVEDKRLFISREAIESMGNGWWRENLDRLLDYIKAEGVRIYGKILGRKKWQKVEKRLSDEGS